MDTDMRLFEQLLCAMGDTEEWTRITYEDPVIDMEEKRLAAVMQKLASLLSDDLYSELEDAIGFNRTSYIDAAMLFGMRVARLLQHIPSNPAEFSTYSARMMAQRMGRISA